MRAGYIKNNPIRRTIMIAALAFLAVTIPFLALAEIACFAWRGVVAVYDDLRECWADNKQAFIDCWREPLSDGPKLTFPNRPLVDDKARSFS